MERGPFGSKNRYERKKIVRYFDCSDYEDCLDVANHKRWKTFTCEGCCELSGVGESLLTVVNLVRTDFE